MNVRHSSMQRIAIEILKLMDHKEEIMAVLLYHKSRQIYQAICPEFVEEFEQMVLTEFLDFGFTKVDFESFGCSYVNIRRDALEISCKWGELYKNK